MTNGVAYGIVLAVTALTTLVLMPVMQRIALRTGAIVAPDERRVHTRPTPLLGGVAMLIGFLVGMFVAWRLDAPGLAQVFSSTEVSVGSVSLAAEPLGVVVAAVLMLIVGTIDDVREVSAPAKVAGTVLCASILVYSGVAMIVLRIPFEGTIQLNDGNLSFLVSVIWVLGMTTAINLIDGLDGLAAGIVAIAAGAYFLYTVQLYRDGLLQPGNIAPLLVVMVLGMCLGYLPFNFHPARIFMGDGGALLLGLLMAASTMVVGGRVDRVCVDTASQQCSGQTYFLYAPIFIPLFILGVPILDTLLAIIRRASKRAGVATADKEHIHHRLMRLGHGQRRSVLILWGWTALLSALVLYPTYSGGRGNGFVGIGIAALGLLLYTVLHPGARLQRAASRAADEADAEASGGRGGADASPVAAGVAAGTAPAPSRSRGRENGSRNGGAHRPKGAHGGNGARGRSAPGAPGVSPAEALAALDAATPTIDLTATDPVHDPVHDPLPGPVAEREGDAGA